MEQLPGLDDITFDMAGPSPDKLFYAQTRFVEHIDAAAKTFILLSQRQPKKV